MKKQTHQLLDRVELRVAYLIAQTRRALRVLLSQRAEQGDLFDFYTALKLSTDEAFQPDITDLDRFIEAWEGMIPPEPAFRAAFMHALAEKYTFTRGAVNDIREHLGIDTTPVQAAFEEQYNQPLESIYSEETIIPHTKTWSYSLGGLDDDGVRALEAEIDWIHIAWGDVLFRQGDAPDNLYVVANGRLRILDENPDGTQDHIRDIGPGTIVGELALLTGEPRTATVLALRDTELVRLTQAGLERIVEGNPRVLTHITRQMVRRLDENQRKVRRQSRVKVIALLPTHPGVPLDAFSQKLANELALFGPVLRVDQSSYFQMQGEHMIEGVHTMHQLSWMEEQEAEHRFVIYDAEAAFSPWTRRCLGHGDRIVIVGTSRDSPALSEAEAELNGPKMEKIATLQELVILHQPGETPRNTAAWLADRPSVFRHHHVRLTEERDIKRVARFLSGHAVGLSLGGGGARGLAHLGVLMAFEEMGIPVDVIGGVSFGAIVAAAYAKGYNTDEMTELFKELSGRFRRYMDVTIPLVSVVAGRRLNSLLREYYGDDTRIEDLWTHCYAVSANLNQGGPRVHQTGQLWRAVRASISIPVLFPPVLYEGELHTDGGAFTNMPADITLEILGRGTVIGSSVTPKDEIQTRFSYGDAVGGFEVLRSRLRNAQLKVPNAVDVLVWAMGLSNSYLRPAQDAAADIILNLPVETYELFDFDAFDALVEAGYNTAKTQLAGWQPYEGYET